MSNGVRDIDWVYLDYADRRGVQVGDTVCTDAGGMPTYRVLAITDGRAWLRDERDESDHLMPLTRFLWKASPDSSNH